MFSIDRSPGACRSWYWTTGFSVRETAMTLSEAELAAPTPATRVASPLPADAGRPPETARLAALWLRAERARQRAIVLRAQGQALRAMRTRVSAQELLASSPLARLRARAATMPVIEQAKGILMAMHGCSEDEAFDLLRRVSQRSNTPIRVLAEQIVSNVPQPDGRSTGTNGSGVQRPGRSGVQRPR